MTFQGLDKEPFLQANASMLDPELEFILPSHSVRALAASEAGRTARAGAAKTFDELARLRAGLAALRAPAFECQPLEARSTFLGDRLCIPAMPNV